MSLPPDDSDLPPDSPVYLVAETTVGGVSICLATNDRVKFSGKFLLEISTANGNTSTVSGVIELSPSRRSPPFARVFAGGLPWVAKLELIGADGRGYITSLAGGTDTKAG
jgi:hypothetical protein